MATMGSRLEESLHCSVCRDVFQEPVFLTCRHSFCKSCLRGWWSQTRRPECPLCRAVSPEWDPPLNIALNNVCEAFSQQRAESQSVGRPRPQAAVHPVAARPPVGRPHRQGLRGIHRRFSSELELFGDAKEKCSYPEVATNIEVQARVTERRIEDVFAMLKKMLKREKLARIQAVREEKEEKRLRMKRLMEILKDDIQGLSDGAGAAPRVLDLPFWQATRKGGRKAPARLPELPQLLAGGQMEVEQHLSNLPYKVLDSMRNQLSHQAPHSQQANAETSS